MDTPTSTHKKEMHVEISSEKTSQGRLRSVRELMMDGYSAVQERYQILLPLALLLFIATALPQVTIALGNHHAGLVALSGLLSVIVSLSSLPLTLALIRISVDDNATDTRRVIYSAFRQFFPLIWVALLQLFFVAGGSFFFVIPGIIFSIWFGFSLFAFARGYRGTTALLYSKHLVKGRVWAVVGRYLAITILSVILLGAVSIATALIFGKGVIFALIYGALGSVVSIVLVSIFSRLFMDLESVAGEFMPNTKDLKRAIIISILGYLLIPIMVGLGLFVASRFIDSSVLKNPGSMNRVMSPDNLKDIPLELQGSV